MTAAQRYRKKPIVVEAIQWTGDNLGAVQAFVGRMENMDGDVSLPQFFGPRSRDKEGERMFNNDSAHLWVESNTKWLPIVQGEWIIEDPARSNGYFYPCKSDIFEATYEKVSK